MAIAYLGKNYNTAKFNGCSISVYLKQQNKVAAKINGLAIVPKTKCIFPQVESSKQSAYKFLKVLSGLRDWEICGPDVSASIEFCRDKIVEMTVEEYEEWFQQVPILLLYLSLAFKILLRTS